MVRFRVVPLLVALWSVAPTTEQRQTSPLLDPASPAMRAQAPARFRVTLDTTKGLIVIDVTREWAPIGTDRFYNLVRQGYYDEVRFHRIRAGFWAQFGINGTPAIAKAWRNATIADDPFRQSNVRGTVAFAFAVPNGRTTQVFINLRDNSATHDKEPFVPFGVVVQGMDVADALNAEYGETAGGGIRAGKQDIVFEGGNALLAREFPRLDYIRTARIEELAWVPDLGNGRYRNPILHADYSDPDAVRVGSDFYLIASSFTSVPGIPILHSKDLVNWQLVNHALPRLVPEDVFRRPQHGNGVWAPALRHHAGKFWIYYPDPDYGLYVTIATDPRGAWSPPVLVKAGKGLIDPCPLFDDDGRVYLVHAWARSRSGINNILTLNELSADGTKVIDEGRVVIDGNALDGYRTLEGPKLYKRDGWYYVFAPAGGVKEGWQSVFRSRAIRGPYEGRIVLEQGRTDINGPHQGALVDTPNGASWFLHFQDLDAYGRVVHLQPVEWRDGWPVMGSDADGDGRGEPLRTARTPDIAVDRAIAAPATSDEFDGPGMGLQWQWQANPDAAWSSLTARPGTLRLTSVAAPSAGNLWNTPNLLLQKLPAPAFVATAVVEFKPVVTGEQAGLVVFGADYSWIGLRRSDRGTRLVVMEARSAAEGNPETEIAGLDVTAGRVHLRATVREKAVVAFSYSLDGRTFTPLGGAFTAKPGRWVGAKIGLFAQAPTLAARTGFIDVDRFLVQGGQI